MLTPRTCSRMQRRVQELYVDPSIVDYAVRLVAATRMPGMAGWASWSRT